MGRADRVARGVDAAVTRQARSGPARVFGFNREDNMPAKNRPVHITDTHISTFIPGDPTRCVLALAVKDAFPDADAVKVSNGFIDVIFGDTVWSYHIPKNPATYVAAVDAHLDVQLEPMTFRISKPRVEKKKPIRVRKHNRALPTPSREESKKGAARAGKQRSAAAKIRKALKAEFGAATRYLGYEV